jgi:small-conductance mechanosensitive channel
MWTMLTTVGALVGIGFFAVWSVLSNWLCTFVILVTRPFAIGDDVEFVGDPVRGRVVDLNFIYTTLRTDDGGTLQIPNNLFFQKVLKRRRGNASVSLAAQLNRNDAAEV